MLRNAHFNLAFNPVGPGGWPACFLVGEPGPTGAFGAAIGVFRQNAAPPGPCYEDGFRLTGTFVSPDFMLPNFTSASFGVPFTAGQLRLSVTMTAGGGSEMFTLSGSDNRTPGGSGNITLVGGAVSQRTTTGRTANRGILQLTLPEPTAAAGAAAALLVLLACHRLARRRLRSL